MSAVDFVTHFSAHPNIASRSAEIVFRDGCWEWPSESYGRVWVAGASIGVHRLALSIRLGRRLASTEDACHTCDNPPCCNPAHLFAGTRRVNVHDAIAKGRAAMPPRQMGVANCNAVLTDARVVAALTLAASGASDRAVASEFGVTPRAVRMWRTGQSRTAARETFLRQVSDDVEGRNGGKPARVMRWVADRLEGPR